MSRPSIVPLRSRADAWIVGDDTGASSKAIWAVMVGVKAARRSAPSDPSDFGRCYRLLKLVPEWHARIGEMAAVGSDWRALVTRWDDLTELYEEEAAPDPTRRYGWSAPRLYALMKSLRPKEGRENHITVEL